MITSDPTPPSSSDSDWSGTTAPTTFTFAAGTTDGNKTLYGWAKDAAGNVSFSSVPVKLDQTAPVVTFSAPTVSKSIVSGVTLSATDTGGSGVTGYMITASSTTPSPSDSGWSPTAPGSYTFIPGTLDGSKILYGWAIDAAGNISFSSAPVTLDQTPPTIAITTVANPTNQNSQTLGITASDTNGVTSVTVQVGTGAAVPATISGIGWVYALTGLIEGPNGNDITVTALDTAGNSAIATTKIIVDKTLPTLTLATITSPTKLTDQLLGGSVSSSSQTIASVTVQVGTGTTAAATITGGSWSYQLSALPAGSNSITIVARDTLGNSSTTSTTIIVDQAAPTLTIDPVTTPTSLTTQTITGTTTDANGIKTLTINGATVAVATNGTFSHTVALTNGSNTITIMATDNAGNTTLAQRTIVSNQLYPTGDINNDGVVDVADALQALQIAVGLKSATADNIAKGDVAPLVNGKPVPDGVIDIGDAVVILQKVVDPKKW